MRGGGGSCHGGSKQIIEVFVKIQKKIRSGVGLGRGVRLGDDQGGCERRSEVL